MFLTSELTRPMYACTGWRCGVRRNGNSAMKTCALPWTASSNVEAPFADGSSINGPCIARRTSSVPRHPSSCSKGIRCMGISAEAVILLDDVRRAMEGNPEAAREAALRLVTLLPQPAAADSAGVRGALAPYQKRKVDRYLREHVERPLRVDELAELLALSVSHFCRAFKKSFGTTPHMHVIRLRLELAQRLMLTTRDPLSQIALACGLADQAHLSKLFRRAVGETPSAWRRRNLTDAYRGEKPPLNGKSMRRSSLGV